MPPRSGLMTRSAAGTAGVNGVHQRQRTVDASSGLSQDLSSLDEGDNLKQQRCCVARCRVRSCSGSSSVGSVQQDTLQRRPTNQRLNNAPITQGSLSEKESAFVMSVARGHEHQASTPLEVSAVLVWLSAQQAHWRKLSQWIMGGLRQCRSSSSWIVTRSIPLVPVGSWQWIRFRRKECHVHGGQCHNAMKSACKASSVTWRSPRAVSRETRTCPPTARRL